MLRRCRPILLWWGARPGGERNQPIPRDTMDQVNLPDPVKEDISNLQHANSELINRTALTWRREVRYLKRTEEKAVREGKCAYREVCRQKERCHEKIKCCQKGQEGCPVMRGRNRRKTERPEQLR